MPIIIILSFLPQVTFTFSFALKTQLNEWQRHALLGAHLLSNFSRVLDSILYVMFSSVYKKEFRITPIGNKLSIIVVDDTF